MNTFSTPLGLIQAQCQHKHVVLEPSDKVSGAFVNGTCKGCGKAVQYDATGGIGKSTMQERKLEGLVGGA